MDDYHVPVMLEECMAHLRLRSGAIYFDGTLGGGGHTRAILERTSPDGRVYATDLDSAALDNAGRKLGEFSDRLTLIHGNFKDAAQLLERAGVGRLDGVLLDLGISSRQIDDAERGFSYMKDAALDMRMDTTQYLSAKIIVNEYSEAELDRIIRDYGEEDFHRPIARKIVAARQLGPIETTGQLVSLITETVPRRYKDGHPAKKTFLALRTETNAELTGLDRAVRELTMRLKRGGRICVITFQSLEDRIVKHTLKRLSENCICDKAMPICTCGHKAEVKLIAMPLMPTDEEKQRNPRAHSAKLRVAERINTDQ